MIYSTDQPGTKFKKKESPKIDFPNASAGINVYVYGFNGDLVWGRAQFKLKQIFILKIFLVLVEL